MYRASGLNGIVVTYCWGEGEALQFAKLKNNDPPASGGFQGQATDIEIHAKEILSTRSRLNEIYVKHTGQKLDKIEKAMERDNFMTPEEALSFGLIDEVVEKRPADQE